MPYDLFISYARRDNQQGRITQLVERIKADFAPFAKRALVPFFDQQEIYGMEDWRQRILQGLRESRLLLACLSPAYLQSAYCEWEFVEYLKYEIGHLHGFNGVAPIYFVEVPGWTDKGFEQQCAAWVAELRKRQHFDLRPWHDQGEDALREAAVQERMAQLNRQIARTIMRGERAEQSLGNVDAHNPHFIGRTANLRMLRENFVTPGHIGVVTAVNGVGGLGKTALAIEYAHAFADEYGGGRWQVRCAGKDDLRLALAELATPIGFEFTEDEKKNADLQFERTRCELKKLADARTPHRCLLLLDNVERSDMSKPGVLDPTVIAKLDCGDWLHVLATTRLGPNELHGSHKDRAFLPIDELPPDDALALIESYQPRGMFRSEAERAAAREIVRLLGCFTLAVESAAVYLGQFANDVTCIAFLARLKKEGLEGLDTAASQSSEGVLHGEKRLGATLQPTLERLGAPETLALEFAALLPPDQVPLPWLRTMVAKTFPEMERDAEPGYPDPWKNVLRRLFSLRLMQATDVIDSDGQPLVVRIHRLLQEFVTTQSDLSEKADRCSLIAYADSRARAFKGEWLEWENRWEMEPLLVFAEQSLTQCGSEASSMANEVTLRLADLGRFADAERLLRHSIGICAQDWGADHADTISQAANLATLLLEQGKYAEAEPHARRAMVAEEQRLGPEHPSTLTSLNTLAMILEGKGNYAEAQPLLRRGLELSVKVLGPTHLDTHKVLNNLAVLLQQMGEYEESSQLLRRGLEVSERVLGSNHPNALSALNNLALLLQQTGHYDEAEPLARRAFEENQRVLGPDHPTALLALNNLALLLQQMGHYAEAEPLARRTFEESQRVMGSDHPTALLALNNLAGLLQKMGHSEEAEPLFRRALDSAERQLGVHHPKTEAIRRNLEGGAK